MVVANEYRWLEDIRRLVPLAVSLVVVIVAEMESINELSASQVHVIFLIGVG